MKYIVSGTNRPNSRTRQMAEMVQGVYAEYGEAVEIIDLQNVPLNLLEDQYGSKRRPELVQTIDKINHADGLIIVTPEYNGSAPGVLKYFMDHWQYPDSFEYRPVAFVGLGGRFGGLRPVEHLQQIFGHRNAFIYPERVFVMNVSSILSQETIEDNEIMQLLRQQTVGFQKFVKALQEGGIDANSVRPGQQ